MIAADKEAEGRIGEGQVLCSVGYHNIQDLIHILGVDVGNGYIVQTAAVFINRIGLTVYSHGVILHTVGSLKVKLNRGFRQEDYRSTVDTHAGQIARYFYIRAFLSGNIIAGLDLVALVCQISGIVIKEFLCCRAIVQQLEAQILRLTCVDAVQQGGDIIADAVGLIDDLNTKIALDDQFDLIRHLGYNTLNRYIVVSIAVLCYILDSVGFCHLFAVHTHRICEFGMTLVLICLGNIITQQMQNKVVAQRKLLGNIGGAVYQSRLRGHRQKADDHAQGQKDRT